MNKLSDKKDENGKSLFHVSIGAKGGSAKHTKPYGLQTVSPERRKEIALLGQKKRMESLRKRKEQENAGKK